MRHTTTIAFLFLTFLLSPGSLQAQSDSLPLAALPELFMAPESEAVAVADTHDAADEDQRATRTPGHWHRQQIFASADRHPLTPRDIEMRDAVRKLGVNRHRFVRCKLRDGSAVVGGITRIGQEGFSVTQGIWGGKYIPYSCLVLAPAPDAAPAEHLANGLKWTGVVTVCVVAVPVVIALLPILYPLGITD